MSGRPLELKTFRIWVNGLDDTLYADKPGEQWPVRVGYEVLRKRLTDAELAAEVWSAKYAVHLHAANGPKSRRAFYEACVLERFATHPHHDEADYA